MVRSLQALSVAPKQAYRVVQLQANDDFPAEIRDSITAGALSRRAFIKATALK
jgi:hypothetical protein